MQKTVITKLLSLLLTLVLIAAMALLVTGCDSKGGDASSVLSEQTSSITSDKGDENLLGEGKTTFNFKVVDLEGKTTSYQIKTDKTIVGEALLELKLIAGEEGAYGLYVKTVNGVTVDYDKDGKYWAFYEGDNYAAKGVDLTTITEGATYSFKAE